MSLNRRSLFLGSIPFVAFVSTVPARAQGILSGLFGGTHFPTEPFAIDAAAAARAISDFRKLSGLVAVTVSSTLMKVATTQAKAMAEAGIMSHDVAGSFPTRLSAAGYAAAAAVENIAAGQKSFAEVFGGWQKSPGHRENLLAPDVNQLGIAAYRGTGSKYGIYWSLALGSTRR
ncbi:MAG: CAP domain-containing protein [Bauldia sp.]